MNYINPSSCRRRKGGSGRAAGSACRWLRGTGPDAGGTAVSQGRDAAADPLSPGDQESIDPLHGRHRRATVPRAMPCYASMA